MVWSIFGINTVIFQAKFYKDANCNYKDQKFTVRPACHGTFYLQTSMIEEKEIYNRTKANILAMMDVAMGGRVAEELIYGPDKVTTGRVLVEQRKYVIFLK